MRKDGCCNVDEWHEVNDRINHWLHLSSKVECEFSPGQTITFRIYERQHNLSNVCILPEEKKERIIQTQKQKRNMHQW
jgi:hypothetical protein